MQYDLVFEGGGAKGMVFAGAMQEFEERGHTYGRLLGTSAGAIAATLLAAGYTAPEILAALSEQEDGAPIFAGFMATPPEFDDEAVQNSAALALLQSINAPLLIDGIEDRIDYWLAKTLMQHARHLFSLIERGGWFSAQNFVTWLERKLDEGAFQGKSRRFSGMTMQQFFEATGRELSLVTSDTVGGRMLVLNHQTSPDLPVVWAVRMSMSIPMVWPEVEWQANWGAYQGKDITGHSLVDGGLLSNFPIELFVSSAPYVVNLMGQKKSDHLLGLLIDETLPVPGAPVQTTAEPAGFSLDRLKLVQRIGQLVNTATGAHDKMVIEAYEQFVIRLPAQGYGTTEFDMSDERREALVAAGRQAMKDYLDGQELAAELSFDITAAPPRSMNPANHADQVSNKILNW